MPTPTFAQFYHNVLYERLHFNLMPLQRRKLLIFEDITLHQNIHKIQQLSLSLVSEHQVLMFTRYHSRKNISNIKSPL